MAVEAVIFDWGGTLAEWVSIDTVDVWGRAARSLAGDPEHHPHLTAALYEAEARFWARCSDDQRAGCSVDIVADAMAALRLDGLDAALIEAAQIEAAAAAHLDAWAPHIRHDPDAVEVLGALRARGLRVGLLSNTHWPGQFHDRHLDRDGLLPLFDARLYTSDLTHMKPHPGAFMTALAALEVDDPAAAVYVGDRPFDDIHGAKSVGMRAVLRPNPDVGRDGGGLHTTEPDAVITRLPELLSLIDGWLDTVP